MSVSHKPVSWELDSQLAQGSKIMWVVPSRQRRLRRYSSLPLGLSFRGCVWPRTALNAGTIGKRGHGIFAVGMSWLRLSSCRHEDANSETWPHRPGV